MTEDLFRAVRVDSLEEVKKFIVAGTGINSTNEFGRTPLIKAVMWNRTDIVQWLIKVGAKIDLVDGWGETALISSVKYVTSHLAMVQTLIRAGASIHIADNMGQTAIGYATKYGRNNIVRYLTHVGMVDTTLALAPLELSPYVLLWILQWAYQIKDGEQLRVLRLVEGIQRSRTRIMDAR
jgi:hypothetical protein